MYLYYIDSTLIANNEIYLRGNGYTTAGIYLYNPVDVRVINNTIYTIVDGYSGTNQAYFNDLYFGYSSVVRNNIFVASGGDPASTYAFYLNGSAYDLATYSDNYDIDYNAYYSDGNYLGYVVGTPVTDISSWKAAISPLDSHSVNLFPNFMNPKDNLALKFYTDTLSCPRYWDAFTDIRNVNRPDTTVMGAYAKHADGLDLSLERFDNGDPDALQSLNMPINVIMRNSGNVPITNAWLGWSVNGILQSSVEWSSIVSLDSAQEYRFHVVSFPLTGAINYDIMIWVESVNGETDMVTWNDTLQDFVIMRPLAEFVSPFVADTIMDLSFAVNVFINPLSGATITPPNMTIISVIHETTTLHDTIPLLYNNGIWRAMIPPQYYGTKVIYSIALSDTIGNSIILTDSTYIRSALSILGDAAIMSSLMLVQPLNTIFCLPDSTSVEVELINKGAINYDFSRDTVLFELEMIDPDNVFYSASVSFAGVLQAGTNTIELLSDLPLTRFGEYHIKIWTGSSTDKTPSKDTLHYTCIAGKVNLSIDEDFSNSIPLSFNVWGNNSSTHWTVVSEGRGADTTLKPVFGNGMLAFEGSRGATSVLATRQLDLSNTIQPSLTFWYFHDTVFSKDYTDVRITTDEGLTYLTLFSLLKYNPVYGWKQYSIDLPATAVGTCVIIIFEAMEKSVDEDVVQYIDRIYITAKQDIAVKEIFASKLSVCDLEKKSISMVITNLSDIVLSYDKNPTTFILEVAETGDVFTQMRTSGSLSRFDLDTIIFTTDFNFTKGMYHFKAYFSSLSDADSLNDTLETILDIHPDISLSIHSESGNNTDCLTGNMPVRSSVTIRNTGNLDLFDLELTLRIDTGEAGTLPHAIIEELCTDTILVGDSLVYLFDDAYSVPWVMTFYTAITAHLLCDSSLIYGKDEIMECVDTKDLHLMTVDFPSSAGDLVGDVVHLAAQLYNRSNYEDFEDVEITLVVTNSQEEQTQTFTETIDLIEAASTELHTFASTYIVPNDTVYYLTIYIESYDDYSDNDTLTFRRETNNVNLPVIDAENGFILYQNIPNPADGATSIHYYLPEDGADGDVIFRLYSISGQLLYSEVVNAKRGLDMIKLNTAIFAAGVYFYDMEYKGRRIVKRLTIK
jgi:hypothetical protein